ncbi:putative reverse transcriptase zinc-binding domain-containing protein [Helianthus annuus]|nr:putative reverse transcriptase zinc-binding domain-containing protein [Helianthus annuus]KAJ0887230.1 putative reverse transcriptase zinc-binding domain-containing protein [Helianthus annuus]
MGSQKKKKKFAWRAEQDRLATLKGLQKKNMLMGSAICRLCGEAQEDADHLFVSCYTSTLLWQKVSEWCNIPQLYAFSIRDPFQVHKGVIASEHKRCLLQVIILASCWAIWKARNDLIFNGKRVSLDRIFGEMQVLAFLWIRNRSKTNNTDWDTWVNFSFS